MGLDITAISKMQHVGEYRTHDAPDGDGCEEDDNHWVAFAYASFPRSMRGLTGVEKVGIVGDGFIGGDCYAETADSKSHNFRAGSYSGYGRFREALAELMGHTPSDYWNDVDEDEPFYELINFADNEGTIGPEAAADLLEDFRKHRDLFIEGWPDFTEVYDDWIIAFELASDAGIVSFH